MPAFTAPLGIAADYNVFVLGNINQHNTDIEGRVAVGGSAVFTNFGIGSALTAADSSRLDLVVGGNLTFTNGQIYNGSGTYGSGNGIQKVSVPNGTLAQAPSAIDFISAGQSLVADSDGYAALAAIVASPAYGGLNLVGSDSTLNVFLIAAGTLGSLNSLNITAPSGSTVIVNVAGSSNTFSNAGMSLTGVDKQKVLFNFYETSSLTLSGIGFQGSILAPEAAIKFNNGQVNGSIIAASLQGSGETHNYVFNGSIPSPIPSGDPVAVPEPSTWICTGAGLALVALGAIRRRRQSRQ